VPGHTLARSSHFSGNTLTLIVAYSCCRTARWEQNLFFCLSPQPSVCPQRLGEPDSEYVFIGDRLGKPIVSLRKSWERICAAAQIENVRLHDLRHSFASVAAAGGLSLPVIGALLGHSQPSTTARYAHLAASPLHQAADAIGAQIVAAMSGRGNALGPGDATTADPRR
jgi:integrase